MNNFTVECMDNCFVGKLSFADVERAFEERIDEWGHIVSQFDGLSDEWPMDTFTNPEIPTILYMAIRQRDRSMQGLLQVKVHKNDYALIRVLLGTPIPMPYPDDHGYREHDIEVTGALGDALAKDCFALDVSHIIIPRAKGIQSAKLGGDYNFFANDTRKAHIKHLASLCMALVRNGYKYLHLEAPYATAVISVKFNKLHFLEHYIQQFLFTRTSQNPEITSLVTWCRLHPVELWRVQTDQLGHQSRFLRAEEVDIFLDWQKHKKVHPGLSIDETKQFPTHIFNSPLFPVPEHASRLQVVAYKFAYRVPPHLWRLRQYEWWNANWVEDVVQFEYGGENAENKEWQRDNDHEQIYTKDAQDLHREEQRSRQETKENSDFMKLIEQEQKRRVREQLA